MLRELNFSRTFSATADNSLADLSSSLLRLYLNLFSASTKLDLAALSLSVIPSLSSSFLTASLALLYLALAIALSAAALTASLESSAFVLIFSAN